MGKHPTCVDMWCGMAALATCLACATLVYFTRFLLFWEKSFASNIMDLGASLSCLPKKQDGVQTHKAGGPKEAIHTPTRYHLKQ